MPGFVLALLGPPTSKIRPAVGWQEYRTTQYLSENSTIKPCFLFAMQIDGLDAWRARFGHEATRALLQYAYDRINGASRNDNVAFQTSDHQFYAPFALKNLCDVAATKAIGNPLQKVIYPVFQIERRSHYFSLSGGIGVSRHYP